MAITKLFESLVLVGQQNGVVVIPEGTPLTRLNYFDGKFLRASDLKAEQDYLRQLVRQSNQAGGAGVAYGYDVMLGVGDTLEIGAGLAIDPQGRALLLPRETTINIQELIEKSRALQNFLPASKVQREGGFELCELSSETPPVNPLAASNLFVITLSHAEALCGEEDVFGKLCEEACVTSSDRPFVVEGLVVRAIPLALQTPLPNSKAVPMAQIHLRSRVASAYFEDERRRVASLISKAGLEQATWCLGADAEGGGGVPIGVVAREGATTIFLDPWITRRERMDAPAKRYWQWRMMMRPWDVFLAQILQFQCQLHDLFKKIPGSGGDDDPCGGAGNAIKEAAETIAELTKFYEAATNRFVTLRADFAEELTIKGGLSRLNLVNKKLITVSQALDVAPQDRLLIRGGIVELPSAGYLPVVPGAGLTINQQVRRMMGEGVDLRFCVVRHDYVAHALEEAQHMERISLLQGLDDPANKPQVDILVPDGQILEQQRLSPGRGFEAAVDVHPGLLGANSDSSITNVAARIDVPSVRFNGAARSEKLPSGGGAAYISAEHVVSLASIASSNRATTTPQPGATINVNPGRLASLFERAPLATAVIGAKRAGLWISLQCERNIFTLGRGDTSNVNARAVVGLLTTGSNQTARLLQDVELNGIFEITQAATLTGSARVVKGRFRNAQFSFIFEEPLRETSLVDLDATITLTGTSAIKVVLTNPEAHIELSASWDKQPLEVKADIIFLRNDDGEQQEIILTEAALKENAGVLSDKDPNHIRALDALEVVAATLGDINFADAKARLLFPPPPKPTDELIVRGTRDWVLFHRRRAKVCSEEKLAPPPPPSRRYQAWHLLAPSLGDAERIVTALQNNDTNILSRFQFARVNRVEFGGGVATMLTSPDDLTADWRRVNPGDWLFYSSIASRGGAISEGENLALSRLSRVEDVVDDVSARHAEFRSEALEAIPTPFLEDDVDGAIIMLTVNQDETVSADLSITMTVLPPQPRPGEPITYTLNFANNGPNAASNVTVTDTLPANITFQNASVTAGTGWNFTPQPIGAPMAVFSKASVAAGETATILINAAVRPDATGAITNTANVKSATADPNAGNDNASATVTVIAETQRTAVVIFAPVAGGIHFLSKEFPHATVVFKNNAPEGDVLKSLIESVPPTQFPINGVALAVLKPPVDDGANTRVTDVVGTLVKVGLPTAGLHTATGALSDKDRENLPSIGVKLDGVDEVIFLEKQG